MSEKNREVAIKVTGVTKNFLVGGKEIPILYGVDFEIYKGEFVLLVGPSGCGKSTLLHIVYGLEPPTAGTVFIGDEDEWIHTKNWRANFRNINIGFIPQQPFWIRSLTVIENIAIPAVISGQSFHDAIQKAAKLIELVGMGEWADHRPYDLSGGQQQRVALARALLLDPKFIIADEPTGNLDQKAGGKLMELIQNINEEFQITVLMVTHNTDQYKFGSRIIQMVDGKIVSDIENKHYYKAMKDSVGMTSEGMAGSKIKNKEINTQ
jgi:putative ABC transport system ATP-binding protein